MFLSKVCFATFSEKCKELQLHKKYTNYELHQKYTLLVGPAEKTSSPTISQIEQNLWFYFIYKHLEKGASLTVFWISEK